MKTAARGALLCAGWLCLFYALMLPGWRSIAKIPFSELTLDAIGSLIWSAGWRLGALWALAFITFSSKAKEPDLTAPRFRGTL